MSDPLEEADEAYRQLRTAEDRYWLLLRTALRGETYSPAKLRAAASEVRARQTEFLAVGDFLFPGTNRD